MVFGWRKAFCTSISTNQTKHHRSSSSSSTISSDSNPISTSRFRSKFGFLSNPSTPRLRSNNQSLSRAGSAGVTGCRSSTSIATRPANSSLPTSPKLHCRTTSNATPRSSNCSSPRFLSNPSSPKSSSSPNVSLLRATLQLNKSNSSRCGICVQSLNSGQSTAAIFTAECSHSFHISCAVGITEMRCPLCATEWGNKPKKTQAFMSNNIGSDPSKRPDFESKIREIKTGKSLRVYNDDEPLTCSPVSLAQFNTIPESDENDDVEDEEEFPGFFSDSSTKVALSSLKSADPIILGDLEVKLEPESAVVEAGRRYETHVVVMKVKAPVSASIKARRASVDLVTVIDVSGSGGVDLQTVKHAMRLVISLLREMDRLSIIVFSSGSKRLMPLRRMTARGRRSARRIVDSLVEIDTGAGMSVNDAVKKAAKVVEDRRERNPSASILVFSSDGQDSPAVMLKTKLVNSTRAPFVVSTTRFSHLEIPVHSVLIASAGALRHAPLRDSFTERIGGLLNVALRDVKLNLELVAGALSSEISMVYSLKGRPESFGSGSGVVVGDLFAEEEREFLVEVKVPSSSSGSHHVISVRSSIVDPTTSKLLTCQKERRLLIPRPSTVRSESLSIERLRDLHSVSRAVAESRRLVGVEDLSGAYHLLSTARSNASDASDSLRSLNSELAELSRHKQRNGSVTRAEDKVEQLTPTSAWRAAEKLAKVAIMRKHLNRVSDLHGLENARF